MKRLALAIALVLGAGPQAWADLSIDQAPTEMAGIDPGDTFLPGMGPMVDDGDLVGFLPSLGVPGLLPGTPYDTDGFSQNIPNDPFAPTAGAPPGVLVSIDDGDLGPGAGPPDEFAIFDIDAISVPDIGPYLERDTALFLCLVLCPFFPGVLCSFDSFEILQVYFLLSCPQIILKLKLQPSFR